MKRGKFWLLEAITIGLSSTLATSLLLSQMPIFNKLESIIRDGYFKLSSSFLDQGNNETTIVNLNSLDFRQIEETRQSYCDLVNFLLTEGEAKVVVLNIPQTFAMTVSNADSCFADLITNHAQRLVLVSYIEQNNSNSTPVISNYNHLLPYSRELMQYKVNPENILGFFQYQPESNSVVSLTSPSRFMCIQPKLIYTAADQNRQLESAIMLTLQKYSSSSLIKPQILSGNSNPIFYHFFEENQIFNDIGIEQICSAGKGCKATQDQLKQFFDKIIIIGVTSPNNLIESNLPMRSISGESISAVETQAHILTSLLTDNFLRPLSKNNNKIFIAIGSIFISSLISLNFTKIIPKTYFLSLISFSGLTIMYLIIAGYIWFLGLVLPIIFPPLIWIITGVNSFTYYSIKQRRKWIQQRLEELEDLKKVEQKAAITSAKNLLQRVATDIHDGPLQELKLVMDSLEEVQFNQNFQDLDNILDRLENMGHQIRQELYNTSQLAQKMEINPLLREGLSNGIVTTLDQLKNTNKLNLDLVSQIDNFCEPTFNSKWIAIREDIFRFFREAIINVIKHAQPPYGSASMVKICLKQENNYAILEIENDGQNNLTKTQDGRLAESCGYGTKIMTTIAGELPEGQWYREQLTKGGMKVYLCWKMSYFFN